MWLVDTITLTLEHFVGDEHTPTYAILSHTWGTEEISYQDFSLRTAQIETRAGYEKIRRCCKLALDAGCRYVWIDTCCINKESSAELSEAINAMYRWYQKAQVCFAYLEDVPFTADSQKRDELLQHSRWFTRGWTLQELLAPSDVIFLSKEWEHLSTKSDLARQISDITGIDQSILLGKRDLQTVSIACRMSWAAKRQTTRTEDVAYCLMGLFDVNMPMLYGEGEKAFIRLQEEIIRSTEDHSIFAWRDPLASGEDLYGLLAPHPRCFEHTGGFRPLADDDADGDLITLTNRGILLNARQYTTEASGMTATLNCAEVNDLQKFAYICLQPLDQKGSKFARVQAQTLGKTSRRGTLEPMVVKQNPKPPPSPEPMQGYQFFSIKSIELLTIGLEAVSYFFVADHCDVFTSGEALNGIAMNSTTTRIWESPVGYPFRIPSSNLSDSALTIHTFASGLDSAYHARIAVGVRADGSFTLSTASFGDASDEEDDSQFACKPSSFSEPEGIPGKALLQMEHIMTATASLTWEEVGNGTVAFISIRVVHPQGVV